MYTKKLSSKKRLKKAKIALVYDRVNKWGGAERVLLALHEIFPNAPLYTSVYDPTGAPWAKVFPEVKTSFLQKIPFLRTHHEMLGTFMPLAFRSINLSNYDVVISVTSESAKGVKVKKGTLHICYCLTPTRYLWSHHDLYFKNRLLRFFSRPVVWWLKRWDKKAAQRPDVIIAISDVVKKRIKKYYNRNSPVIFPPVDMKKGRSGKQKFDRDYYLLVSRLDYGYKKVDLAIDVFNKLGYPLIIVGTGREERRLRKEASKNIKFTGKISEKKLLEYYKHAKALIMPQEEDFGIVAVEAQSLGIPVIAYKKGGARDTVVHGKTGYLFNKQTEKSLIDAIADFQTIKFDKRSIKNNSRRFIKKRFKKEFLDFLEKMLN